MLRIIQLLFAFIVLVPSSAIAKDAPRLAQVFGRTMGNAYYVAWHSEKTSAEQVGEVRSHIEQRLHALNLSFSNWNLDSDISRFNQSGALQATKLNRDLQKILLQSKNVHQLSQGAFDVTLGPLVKLWGFGPSNRQRSIPTIEEIRNVQAYTGMQHLIIEGDQLYKDHPATEIDLSAIAKGYAVDEVSKQLTSLGIHNFLIEIGGEITTAGYALDQQNWRIKIESPVVKEQPTAKVLTSYRLHLSGESVATSGDYRNFFDQDGAHYSHIINPITGRSVLRDVVSATVIADECAIADGLATSLIAMGTDKAISFAQQHQLAAMIISFQQGKISVFETPKFKRFER